MEEIAYRSAIHFEMNIFICSHVELKMVQVSYKLLAPVDNAKQRYV